MSCEAVQNQWTLMQYPNKESNANLCVCVTVCVYLNWVFTCLMKCVIEFSLSLNR